MENHPCFAKRKDGYSAFRLVEFREKRLPSSAQAPWVGRCSRRLSIIFSAAMIPMRSIGWRIAEIPG